MTPALILAHLLLLQAPAGHAPQAGPRAALAGIAGFQSVSKLDFGSAQNRLTAVYAFPDRVRWHFESYGAVQRSQHQYFYRSGEHVRALVSGGTSQEMEGEDRTAVLLQMELRRALMLWPDGFEWEAQAEGTSAADVRMDACCRGAVVGKLVATLESGRPRRMEVRDAQGKPREAFEVHTWQERHGRTWPHRLTLASAAGGFVETIESIETRVHFLELSFLPPDLRTRPDAREPGPELFARDLVASTFAAHAVPEGAGWEQALALARGWNDEAAKALAPQGLAVDPVPTFELSPTGRPLRCLVRLTAVVRPPPAGHETRDERPGLVLGLPELARVEAELLARLARSVPPGARAGVPYVRVHERKELPVEVVLPLEPGE